MPFSYPFPFIEWERYKIGSQPPPHDDHSMCKFFELLLIYFPLKNSCTQFGAKQFVFTRGARQMSITVRMNVNSKILIVQSFITQI